MRSQCISSQTPCAQHGSPSAQVAERTVETELLFSNVIRKVAPSRGRHSPHERPGETARCHGSPGVRIAFWVGKQNRALVMFAFLNSSSAGLNYWSRVCCCHAGKLTQAMFAPHSAILNSFLLGFKGWHCITRSLGLVLPFLLPSSIPASILRFFTSPNIPNESA